MESTDYLQLGNYCRMAFDQCLVGCQGDPVGGETVFQQVSLHRFYGPETSVRWLLSIGSATEGTGWPAAR
ncbi:MAG: hypothetical protein ACRDQH_16520, partial [Pseudonocardiaceae bacterium]